MNYSRLYAMSLIAFIAITLSPAWVYANTCLAPTISSQSDLFSNDKTWTMQTGELTGEIGQKIKIKDKIKIVSGSNKITAEEVVYNEEVGSIRINKGLILENNNLLVFAEGAVIKTDNNSYGF